MCYEVFNYKGAIVFFAYWSGLVFLNLGTTNILSQIFFAVEDCLVHCKTFSSVLLDTSSRYMCVYAHTHTVCSVSLEQGGALSILLDECISGYFFYPSPTNSHKFSQR